MTDLNDLKVFERVAALESFSAAGRALGMPKSTVSRCIARLEVDTRWLLEKSRSEDAVRPGMAEPLTKLRVREYRK